MPLHELLPGPSRAAASRGCRAPSAGDVFFDIEGDPYWGDDGLEYLFGIAAPTEAATSRCGRTTAPQERAAFEHWMDWITARLERYPDLHVYHYNHYEPTALKGLMARYGTREHEVDELLRRKVFVDLYAVVRQALRVGTESYSLKAVEALYPFERDAEVTEAGGSILAYQEYLADARPAKLDAIADYNADDCRSTPGCATGCSPSAATSATSTPRRRARRAPSSSPATPRSSGSRRELLADAERPRHGGCSPTCSTTTAARRSPSGGRTSTGSGAPPASCATRTPRRSATSSPPTTCRWARSPSPTCTRCASRPSSTSSRRGSRSIP